MVAGKTPLLYRGLIFVDFDWWEYGRDMGGWSGIDNPLFCRE